MSVRVPELPGQEEWRRFGVGSVEEVHAGQQSRVFAATVNGAKAAVKLTDRSLADRDMLAAQMSAVEALATEVPHVVGPMRIGGELVNTLGEWWMTAAAFVDGDQLDVTNRSDAHLMGRILALLHKSMARLPVLEIPPVAALDVADRGGSEGDWQLLHGDFSDQNLVATPDGLRIFDFDDCGYGPVEYDVANSLYMVLFDDDVNDQPARYHAFRPAFVAGYGAGAGRLLDEAVVDGLIDARIGALGRWLEDLSTAPIGIRTSSPEWLDTLDAFVRSHRS